MREFIISGINQGLTNKAKHRGASVKMKILTSQNTAQQSVHRTGLSPQDTRRDLPNFVQ